MRQDRSSRRRLERPWIAGDLRHMPLLVLSATLERTHVIHVAAERGIFR